MTIKLGFSPCPNDTYIFDALANQKIDTEGLSFEITMADVQQLNEWAAAGKLDVAKVSYGSLPLLLENYLLLDAGGALGKGVGPVLISKIPIPDPAIKQCVIAIPGKFTTAHALFSMAYPDATNKVFLRYDEIEDFTLGGAASMGNLQAVKLGVIIHENRFTYAGKGLVKLADLGEFWEKETGLPIPLGGIVARRDMDAAIQVKINRLIRKSLEYSNAQGGHISDFVKDHAREMDIDVMRQHIRLYVNEFSLDLGKDGRKAVKQFIETHSAINKIPVSPDNMFLPE
ncbi:MAG: 1,4-dihydroxy-6-naphthoate synthase [Chitinophagaceae bacterium]|nr:1,4-dihydroxy-6-naphthoate synthase [Chitinophagaceae bacterium]